MVVESGGRLASDSGMRWLRSGSEGEAYTGQQFVAGIIGYVGAGWTIVLLDLVCNIAMAILIRGLLSDTQIPDTGKTRELALALVTLSKRVDDDALMHVVKLHLNFIIKIEAIEKHHGE